MPLPLIPIIAGAAALLAGGVGVGKTVKAKGDNDRANSLNSRANSMIREAQEKLENCRNRSNKELEALGQNKVNVLENCLMPFVRAVEQVKNVDFRKSHGLRELEKFKLDKQAVAELREMGDFVASALGGVTGGAAGGGLTAFGAFGLAKAVGTVGMVKGGTALAGLSGIVGTNATLAFLGGGSLAAGGLGVAGGAAVLGGLVAGPALAIMGFVMGAQAEENLHKAYSNLAEAEKATEELKTAASLCLGIYKRAEMFNELLGSLTNKMFVPMANRVIECIESNGYDFEKYGREDQDNFAAAWSLAGAIKTVLDTPLLTEDGKLTDKSETVGNEIFALVSNA